MCGKLLPQTWVYFSFFSRFDVLIEESNDRIVHLRSVLSMDMCHRAVRVAYGLHQSRVAIRGCGNSSGEDGEQASDRGTWRDERVGPGRDGARRLSLIFPVSLLPRGWLPLRRVSPTSSAR